MRRQRWLMLALISFVMISLTVLSSASWFIVFRRNQAVDFQYVQADTSPYFTTGGTYNGQEQLPTLTEAGKALYGADFAYTVEWQSGKRADGTTAISKTQDAAYLGKAAGKHYYKIVDSKTGQVICQSHEVSISKATLTATNVTLNTLALPGVAVPTHDFTWTGVNGESFRTTELTGVTAPKNFSYAQIIYPVEETVTFDSADVAANSDLTWHYNNYNTASAKVTYKVVATCYSYTGGTATYHGSLDQALDSTKDNTAATTVVAMQSFTANSTTYTADPNATSGTKFTHTITGDHEIGANVTLIVPYRATTTFDATEEGIRNTDRYAISSTETDSDGTISAMNRFTATPACVNEVTLKNGTLNNKGKLQICGLTGFTYPDCTTIAQGATSGIHGTISVENATILMDTGSPQMEVHGYIVNGGSGKVIAKTGTITMPFVVYDYHGGTITVALFKGSGSATKLLGSDTANVSPFNTIDMPNIQTELTCYGGSSGATIRGMANLFTNGIDVTIYKVDPQFNLAEFDVFGDTDALFNMSDGYAVFQYNYENNSTYAYNTTNYKPHRKAATKIVLNGTTQSGDIRMSLNVGFGTANVSLSQVKFPVSDKIKLYLTGAHDYTFTTQYKFLPGSELHIQNGARVLVNSTSGLLFYKSLDVSSTGAVLYKNYYNKDKYNVPALCQIEDGSLIIEGALGGVVTTKHKDAVVDVSRASALSMTEKEGSGTRDTLDFVFTVNQTVSLSAMGPVATGTNSSKADTLLSKYAYPTLQLSNSGYAWYSPVAAVTLNGNTSDGTALFENGGTTSTGTVPVNQTTGTTQAAIDALEKPSRSGYKFAGWYLDAACTQTYNIANIKFSNDTTLYAKWEAVNVQAYITYTGANPGTNANFTAITGENYKPLDDTFVTMTELTNSNNPAFDYYVTGWSAVWTFKVSTQTDPITYTATYTTGQTVSIADVLAAAGVTEDVITENPTAVLTATWGSKVKISVTANRSTVTVTHNGTAVSARPFYLKVGDEFSVTATPNTDYNVTSITIGGNAYTPGSDYTVTGTGNLSVVVNTESTSCIAAGTMITLADGTQKAVEDLLESDILLVFDHETGKYIECPILFIERDGWKEYTVINLTFSNGTTTRLIYEHGLFDLTLNRYVYITEQNYSDFVGHEFAVMDENGYQTVTLTDAFLTEEYTGCYSLVTVYHFNYFIDGLFSMPGGIEGLFNFFEYDESLRFDAEQMAADIEKYGLYTYEDFAPYMPEEIFNLFQAPYYKVAVEKGMITFEEIVALIERYLVQHGFV